MATLSRVGCFTVRGSANSPFPTSRPLLLPIFSPILLRPLKPLSAETDAVSALRSSPTGSELVGEDILQTFFKERQLNGDLISKASDIIWQSEVVEFADVGAEAPGCSPQQSDEVIEREPEDGFLKLTKTHEWVLGVNSAPVNQKAVDKGLQDDCEKRKRLNLLNYEAIKREMLLLSVSIGTACTAYCLLTLSVQAAVSYAVGVLFSCLYLQLLYRHTDNLNSEAVPQIFRKRKPKKIGIRSEDLKDSLEKTIKGSGLALSSPRLVIPAAIYGLWILSHQHFAKDLFDFQLVPAMFGLFAYKAAALVQVYRDNEDLRFIFPDNTEGSED